MTGGAAPARPVASEREFTLRAVTVIMGTVVGLSFLFAFGNVWALGMRLGVPAYVAPLVAPAVDLSVVGLLLATRFLAVCGASQDRLRPARRLLVFASLVTLALNVAEPVIAGQYGKAAFDSVGPLLLIGWAHVGPGLLQAMSEAGGKAGEAASAQSALQPPVTRGATDPIAFATAAGDAVVDNTGLAGPASVPERRGGSGPQAVVGEWEAEPDLLERARAEDARYWELYRRPISAEALRKRLHIGAVRSRSLVAQLRADTGAGSGCAASASTTSSATAIGTSG